jgi:hypothetical protein
VTRWFHLSLLLAALGLAVGLYAYSFHYNDFPERCRRTGGWEGKPDGFRRANRSSFPCC